MTLAEAIETINIYSVVDLTGDRTAFVRTRPFRAPHHTISDAGLIGGGRLPMPYLTHKKSSDRRITRMAST
jgi:magnesium chelatase family protein